MTEPAPVVSPLYDAIVAKLGYDPLADSDQDTQQQPDQELDTAPERTTTSPGGSGAADPSTAA